MKNTFLIFNLAILILSGSSAIAQTTAYKNEFGFTSDNDAYLGLGQDRYYTNGLFITYRHAMDQSKLSAKVNKMVWELEAEQKMYNPYSGNVNKITSIDRPFAAYLSVGGSLNFLYDTENSLKINLQIGSIGPAAKGREVQEFLHKSAGFYEVSGWEWQVKNETGVNTSIEYNHFLSRGKSNKSDFTLNSYANIGNTFAGMGAGMTFRTGSLNQLFNSVTTQSSVSNNAVTAALRDKEFFFYAKPMLHYIAYDATVKGGMFREDKGPLTLDVEPLVFSQKAGMVYSNNRWTADLSVVFKSREIKSAAKAHQYGSVSLYYKFN